MQQRTELIPWRAIHSRTVDIVFEESRFIEIFPRIFFPCKTKRNMFMEKIK